MKIAKYIYVIIILLFSNTICNSQKYSTIPTDTLQLRSGWAWLSFPRLNRSQGDPTVHEVLYGVNGEKIDPSDYEYGSELENLPPNGDLIKYNIFDEGIWQPSGDLSDIQSTLGYKLKLDYDPQYYGDKWLHLKGNVLDPETSIQLYTEKDNWVGYFLYQEQDVFDALADVIDDIYMIKAQDWTCVYTIPCARNANNQGGCWIWDNEVHNVKYGDMLILNTYSNFSFQWNYSGNLSNDEPRAAPEYYSYEEKADYTPMIIELDTVDNLLEIGAFINDSCIGANTVLTDDSIVMLRAYMDGQPGDSVTFEKYFGSSKAYNPPIHEYFVNNIQTGTWEKRTIKTGEKQDYYLISFKTGKITNETESNPVSISCAPNPFKNKVTIKFTVQQECMLQIGVYDLYGKPLNILQEGVSKAGTYHINWTGTDSNGKPLPNGVYILKLKAGTNYAQTKIVIVK